MLLVFAGVFYSLMVCSGLRRSVPDGLFCSILLSAGLFWSQLVTGGLSWSTLVWSVPWCHWGAAACAAETPPLWSAVSSGCGWREAGGQDPGPGQRWWGGSVGGWYCRRGSGANEVPGVENPQRESGVELERKKNNRIISKQRINLRHLFHSWTSVYITPERLWSKTAIKKMCAWF